jgi:hypothetical protein
MPAEPREVAMARAYGERHGIAPEVVEAVVGRRGRLNPNEGGRVAVVAAILRGEVIVPPIPARPPVERGEVDGGE